jgi:hypothetical protein
MDEQPKRRLKLLNEVLPAPVADPIGSPRARTLAHFQRLTSAAVIAAAACSKDPGNEQMRGNPNSVSPGYAVVDPLPPPPRDHGDASVVHATPPPTGIPPLPSAQSVPVRPPKHPRGYAVVDPLPHPPDTTNKKKNKNDPFGDL